MKLRDFINTLKPADKTRFTLLCKGNQVYPYDPFIDCNIVELKAVEENKFEITVDDSNVKNHFALVYFFHYDTGEEESVLIALDEEEYQKRSGPHATITQLVGTAGLKLEDKVGNREKWFYRRVIFGTFKINGYAETTYHKVFSKTEEYCNNLSKFSKNQTKVKFGLPAAKLILSWLRHEKKCGTECPLTLPFVDGPYRLELCFNQFSRFGFQAVARLLHEDSPMPLHLFPYSFEYLYDREHGSEEAMKLALDGFLQNLESTLENLVVPLRIN